MQHTYKVNDIPNANGCRDTCNLVCFTHTPCIDKLLQGRTKPETYQQGK